MKLPEKIKMMSITSSTHDSDLANKINEIISYLANLEEQNNMTNTQQEKQWIQECPRCGGKEWSIPEFICDKCKWQDPVVQENKDQSNTMEEKIKDLASQIILAVKHLPNGITEFQGQQVMDAGDEDMLFDCIEEALKQYGEYSTTVYKSTLQQQVEWMKSEIPLGLEPDEHEEVRAFNAVYNQALDKVLKIISDSK